MKTTNWIWQDGEFKNWADATVHVMAHGLHYGSTVFEGIRCYKTAKGPAIFRLRDHINRLFDSAKMYGIDIPFTRLQLEHVCQTLVLQNELLSAYIRPIVYRDVASLGLSASADDPVGIAVAAIEWGPLHGQHAIENGTDICVSSWRRLDSSSNPVMAKAGGHYLTSQLISAEARRNGFSDGIAVNQFGCVSEAAGANLFLVRRGKLITPNLGNCILEGITRDTIMQIARDRGLEVLETDIPRECLYVADEVFLCGTASEVTPVVSIDRTPIGDGTPGKITRQIQKRFFEVVSGHVNLHRDWLTYCQALEPASASIESGNVQL